LRSIAADDLNDDSSADLVAVGGTNRLDVLLNDGEGRFPATATYRVGAGAIAVALDDADLDGELDVLTVNRGSDDVSILPGLGDGTLGAESRTRVGRAPVALSTGDLDYADGPVDLVVANRVSKSVTVLLNGDDTPQPIVCLVPRVVRHTLASARALVARAHCVLGAVRRRPSSRVARGRVIAQSPVPGARAPRGAAVAVVVSRGRNR
jgi:hypothetical protein